MMGVNFRQKVFRGVSLSVKFRFFLLDKQHFKD